MAARLIIAEHSGGWAAAIRIELAETGVRLWEAGARPVVSSLLAEAPASFLVLELTVKNPPRLLDVLGEMQRGWPDARAAVVADRSLAQWEWLMREAGAVHFLTSPRKLAPLVELACRHLAAAPIPQQTLPESIWSSLPWGKTQ